MTGQVVTYPKPTRWSPTDHHQSDRDTEYGRRILILTAEIGAGHISTAWALKNRLEQEDGSVRVHIDEPIQRVPAFSRLPRLYRFMTAYLPMIWALFYYSRKIKLVRNLYSRFIRHRLRSAFEEYDLKQYHTVIITYSMYCNCIARFTDAKVRTVVLVTDLFGGPQEWFTPGADRYVVPTTYMAAMARNCDIDPERILLRRLPTLVADTSAKPNWSANRRSALRILVIGGSEGLGPLKAAATGILRSQRPASVTVVCGNNVRLQKRLQRSSALACGFVSGVATTYQHYDLVVTKPGSVTLMELFQQNVPFVLLPGIPGIEAGNTRLFKRLQLPRIRSLREARLMPNKLVNGDLSLSALGTTWVDELRKTRDALPTDYLTIEEASPTPTPTYRVARLTA